VNLLPRSLFGRSALLIVLLIITAQLLGLLLMREMILKPRLVQMADGLAHDIGAIRAGLAAMPPAARRDFVDAFNQRTLGRTHDAGAGTPLSGPLTPLERSFVRAVSQRMATEGTTAVWRREAGGSLALRLDVDGSDYWIVLPGLLPAHEFSGAWIAATLASVLLALFGGLLAQRRINRPLVRISAVARTLARGGVPEPLPEDGPTEIATLSRSVNQLVHDLGEIDRERALMLAGVSHDLRTPLAKLRLALEIQRARIEPALLASMTRSIEEMDAIVGQFLDFARLDEAEAVLPVDVDALARDVARTFADEGRTLVLEPGQPPPTSLAPQALRRALVNLVENAWRHGRPPVTVRTGGDDRTLWIEVIDHGDGIPPADAEALKEPFRRAANDRGGSPGAGLGLAIVDRVARRQGGTFDLLGTPGGGLRARITLPRTA
jgi:two-component system osmolarity sensor histidine kinase EnvZ